MFSRLIKKARRALNNPKIRAKISRMLSSHKSRRPSR